MSFSNLKVLAIKEYLESLDTQNYDYLTCNINLKKLIKLRVSIDKELKKYCEMIYVVCNTQYGLFTLSNLTIEFLKIYYPNLMYSWDIKSNWSDYNDEEYDQQTLIFRHEPNVVLTVLLLEKSARKETLRRFKDPIFSFNKLIFNPFETYTISDYDGAETVKIIPSKEFSFKINNRAKTFFADISNFAKENNLELDLSQVDNFPKTGNYRIFD